MIYNKDSRLLLEDVQPNSVHAVITDPPYGLHVLDNQWDKVLPPPEIWQSCYTVMKPGAFLAAFGHTRLYHRLGVQLEDAGLQVRDCLAWCYCTGYPRSINAGLLFDKAAGFKRTTYDDQGNLTAPITDEAKIWNGYGNVLKTAWEPIIICQKPLEGSYVENVRKHKCGVLNIDACRIPFASDEDREAMKSFLHFKGESHGDARYFSANEGGKKQANIHPLGRFPANLVWLDPMFADYDRYFWVNKPSKSEKRSYNEHDTTKPIELMERLVSLLTPNPGAIMEDVIVADPFMGSGSTGIACQRLGRQFIGYELDQVSYETAKRRLDEKMLCDIFG